MVKILFIYPCYPCPEETFLRSLIFLRADPKSCGERLVKRLVRVSYVIDHVYYTHIGGAKRQRSVVNSRMDKLFTEGHSAVPLQNALARKGGSLRLSLIKSSV